MSHQRPSIWVGIAADLIHSEGSQWTNVKKRWNESGPPSSRKGVCRLRSDLAQNTTNIYIITTKMDLQEIVRLPVWAKERYGCVCVGTWPKKSLGECGRLCLSMGLYFIMLLAKLLPTSFALKDGIAFKNGPSSASFSCIFVFSNKHCNFNNKYMWKNEAEIQTHNLQDKSPPITTRPGLPPKMA